MRSSRLDYLSGGGSPGRKPRPSRRPASDGPKPRRVEAPAPASNGVPGPESRRIDIGEIIRTVGMRYTHSFSVLPDPELDGADLRVDVPTHGDLTLTNTGAALILRGKASGALRLSCSRCLEEFVQPVSLVLEEEFDLVSDSDAPQPEELRAV
ncbi:MAG: YceD family protein, partial [Armatimonadota bacterium]